MHPPPDRFSPRGEQALVEITVDRQSLEEIIHRAVADYGFRLAVMWGVEDVATGFGLDAHQTGMLTGVIVPELMKLPNPVEPDDQAAVAQRLSELLS